MEFHVIIPARFNSTRLPGKTLKDIAGKPMIQHVYERAIQSGAESVVVATDDQRIAEVVKKFGAPVCMTSKDHESGTDRIAEAVVALGLEDNEVVVNVQGDEPLIPPAVIRQVAKNIKEYDPARVATLYEPIQSTDELFDPHIVKVVLNKRSYALYFSRGPIPWMRGDFPPDNTMELAEGFHRHVGIYAYRVGFLREFTEWGTCDIENMEALEQLRVLWHGGKVHVAKAVESSPIDVNTENDLAKIRNMTEK